MEYKHSNETNLSDMARKPRNKFYTFLDFFLQQNVNASLKVFWISRQKGIIYSKGLSTILLLKVC